MANPPKLRHQRLFLFLSQRLLENHTVLHLTIPGVAHPLVTLAIALLLLQNRDTHPTNRGFQKADVRSVLAVIGIVS